MVYAIMSLLIIGLVLFILSFFMSNRFKEIESQVEELTISSLQDSYIIKNKLRILEEELLTEAVDVHSIVNEMENNQKVEEQKRHSVVQQIQQMYSEGYSIEEIENKIGISKQDILTIIGQ